MVNSKENIETKKQGFIYRGYIATLEYDRGDNSFRGSVKGVEPLIYFRGTSISELETEFHHKVDKYLTDCKKAGVAPCKQYSGKLSLDITPEWHCNIDFICQKYGMTIDDFVRCALMTSMADYKDVIPYYEPEFDGEDE